MSRDTLRVVAHVHALPETAARARALLETLVPPTRQEEGCIAYEMLVAEDDPTHFTFVEEWTSSAALDAHLASDHFTSVAGKLHDLLAVEPDIGRYRLVR